MTVRAGGILKPLQRPWLWLGLWWMAVALVVVLSLVPPPMSMPVPPHGDKIEHLLAYAALSASLVQLVRQGPALVLGGAGLVLLGLALEWAQASLTTTRQAEAADALANTLGVGLGLLSVWSPWRDALLRLDRRLARR